jgi:hypothetical protein
VAATRVATRLHENGHDIEPERHRRIRRRCFDFHGHLGRFSRSIRFSPSSPPSASGATTPFSTLAFAGSATLNLASAVTSRWTPVRFGEAHDQRLPVPLELEVHIRGKDLEGILRIESGRGNGARTEKSEQGQAHTE